MRSFFRSHHNEIAVDLFHDQTRAFRARVLAGENLLCGAPFFPIASLPDWPGMLERTTVIPLWPVAWLQFVDLRSGVLAILILYLVGALIGAIFPTNRSARTLTFLSVFEFTAFENSFGKINHSMHLWVLTAFILIFLPQIRQARDETPRHLRQRFLIIFWGCQAESSSCLLHVRPGEIARRFLPGLHRSNSHLFAGGVLDGGGRRLQQTASVSLLGPWLIAHPVVGWPFMIADLYLQPFPSGPRSGQRLHRFWAIALILFHIGSYLFLAINFAPMALLVAILLLNSPCASQ